MLHLLKYKKSKILCRYIYSGIGPIRPPRDKGKVLDCTGCRNTQVLF